MINALQMNVVRHYLIKVTSRAVERSFTENDMVYGSMKRLATLIYVYERQHGMNFKPGLGHIPITYILSS
jgi:hypothetical protein